MKKRFLLIPVLLSILVVAGCAPAAPKLALPQGYINVSEVIPAMGEHWLNPENPAAPVYLIYKGEVIGIEYMYTEDMMQEVEIPTPEGPEHFNALASLPVGVEVDHVDVAFMTHGHEGFDVPHWDIHLYFITQAEKATVMPGG